MLVSIDFSQQELRWLAIFTQEPSLLEVYQKGLDMHSRVTCQIHGLSYEMFEQIRKYKGDTQEETDQNISKIIEGWEGTEEIKYAIAYYNSKERGNLDDNVLDAKTIETLANFFEVTRSKTKSVVFGTVYGITEIGLADQIQGTQEEAKSLIDGFKSGLPNYLKWEVDTHNYMMEKGYVETVLGRKRRFGETIAEAKASDLWKKQGWHWLIEKCKRQSTNSIIQGSSADQVKKAMVELHYPTRPDGTKCFDRREWLDKGYKSILEESGVRILLQVHDELIFEAPQDVEWEVLERIAKTMQTVIPTEHLGVEFKSDIEVSPYWGGNFSPEEIKQINEGKLDWREVFNKSVITKLSKTLGHEYELGMFMEHDNEDDDVM